MHSAQSLGIEGAHRLEGSLFAGQQQVQQSLPLPKGLQGSAPAEMPAAQTVQTQCCKVCCIGTGKEVPEWEPSAQLPYAATLHIQKVKPDDRL